MKYSLSMDFYGVDSLHYFDLHDLPLLSLQPGRDSFSSISGPQECIKLHQNGTTTHLREASTCFQRSRFWDRTFCRCYLWAGRCLAGLAAGGSVPAPQQHLTWHPTCQLMGRVEDDHRKIAHLRLIRLVVRWEEGLTRPTTGEYAQLC